jgi:geranylgeranyl transferase type-2 subunit beta
MLSYLEELTIRLARGVAELPERVRNKHANYLKAAQRPDGGFSGREGGSDLYYTAFAMRGLAVLGELHNAVADETAAFLRGRMSGRESIVDFLSLVYGAALLDASAGIDVFANTSINWRDTVADALAPLRRDDGGYAKGAEGIASSTYHTFLVLLCLQLIERPLPEPERVVDFVHSQRCPGGGFREIRASKRAGTNPTAAAIGTLRILDALEDDVQAETVDFLMEMQTEEGGFRANTRIPIADLLSTFTGLLTLVDLRATDAIQLEAARRYAESLQMKDGGFHGAAWDTAHDVEYTFYGLGCLALLTSE